MKIYDALKNIGIYAKDNAKKVAGTAVLAGSLLYGPAAFAQEAEEETTTDSSVMTAEELKVMELELFGPQEEQPVEVESETPSEPLIPSKDTISTIAPRPATQAAQITEPATMQAQATPSEEQTSEVSTRAIGGGAIGYGIGQSSADLLTSEDVRYPTHLLLINGRAGAAITRGNTKYTIEGIGGLELALNHRGGDELNFNAESSATSGFVGVAGNLNGAFGELLLDLEAKTGYKFRLQEGSYSPASLKLSEDNTYHGIFVDINGRGVLPVTGKFKMGPNARLIADLSVAVNQNTEISQDGVTLSPQDEKDLFGKDIGRGPQWALLLAAGPTFAYDNWVVADLYGGWQRSNIHQRDTDNLGINAVNSGVIGTEVTGSFDNDANGDWRYRVGIESAIGGLDRLSAKTGMRYKWVEGGVSYSRFDIDRGNMSKDDPRTISEGDLKNESQFIVYVGGSTEDIYNSLLRFSDVLSKRR